MVNVLLIGSGAREHAIAEAIVKSKKKPKLYSFMKANNPGIAALSEDIQIGRYDDLESIKAFAQANAIDFCFIGPEDPLNNGVVDALKEIGIPSIGPKKSLARLETSKSFTRLLLKKYNIPGNPKFKVFESTDGIKEFLDELKQSVIKPDGLTGGKGVKVQGDHYQTKKEALKYCKEVLKEHSAVVVEEKLDGEEFSLQCFTDGKYILATPPAQDHKRAYVDDKGPNTGGMGSYSCADHLLPFLKKEDIDKAYEITQKVAEAIYKETGEYYKGVMYGGFIVTKYGVKLLEYNARLGDPEVMNVLPILKTDFLDICQGVINGNLSKVKAKFENKATVCKYAVPEGYPENPTKGKKVSLVDIPKDAKVYYASVDKKEDGLYMSGSRAIAFVGIHYDMEKAEVIAENAVSSVKGHVFHREDIGTKELIDKRVKHMEKIRNESKRKN